MPPVHKAALYIAVVFATALLLELSTGSAQDVMLVANVIALIAAVWLVIWYQANTDWQRNLIGRTTMGIKAVFVIMTLAGLLRRARELEIVYSSPDAYLWVDRIGDATVVTAWVCMATILVHRLDALKTLQRWGESHDPCEHLTGPSMRVDAEGAAERD
jgi:hypothetical protein